MANPQHLAKLHEGVEVWNQWRRENPDVRPQLRAADLSRVDLTGACLDGAHLGEVNLFSAKLSGANLSGANLIGADLSDADLNGADLTGAWTARARFVNVDLRGVKGLEAVVHSGPSTIGIDTIYKSGGKIPRSFLRGCGVPEALIAYIPSLVAAQGGIEFHSVFISHSSEDHEFAERLCADLQANDVRCWFAPHDQHGGEALPDQMDRAIQMHDRLLLVVSKNSMNSDWIKAEIREALNRGIKESRRVLYPVSICPYDELDKWQEIDPATGQDYAREIREYFIPDFSNWKNRYTYKRALDEVLYDLQRNRSSLPPLTDLSSQAVNLANNIGESNGSLDLWFALSRA